VQILIAVASVVKKRGILSDMEKKQSILDDAKFFPFDLNFYFRFNYFLTIVIERIMVQIFLNIFISQFIEILTP